MQSLRGITHCDPDIQSGVPVFVGTRIPVHSLFDYLAAGDSLEEFLRQFPTVSRTQAIAVLRAQSELSTR
jgi:uncharacterized protein (DUF433 family)